MTHIVWFSLNEEYFCEIVEDCGDMLRVKILGGGIVRVFKFQTKRV